MLVNNIYTTVDEMEIQKDGSIISRSRPMSAEAIAQLRSDARKELLIRDFTTSKNLLLAQSDWTQLPDVMLGDTLKQKYTEYRQLLREVKYQPDFPFVYEMPDHPEGK